MKVVITSTTELLALQAQGHRVTTLARGKTNSAFIATIEQPGVQDELLPAHGSFLPTHAVEVVHASYKAQRAIP